MRCRANSAWFTFVVDGGSDLAVYAFSGREHVSAPYVYQITVVNPSARLDTVALIGREACLSIADRSGARRFVHGVISSCAFLHAAHRRSHYLCQLVPRLWFLGSRTNQRIFQHLNVPSIVTQLLREHNFPSEALAFKCFHEYQLREYCVQYGESDLHFISRLCEEEGIYYYFEHTEEGHCLCFSDAPGGPPIPGESALRYFRGSGQLADTAVVSHADLFSQNVSDKTICRDWSFDSPAAPLECVASETVFQKAPGAAGIDSATHRFPCPSSSRAGVAHQAKVQLARQLTGQTWLEAQADVARFLPGFTFSLCDHDRVDVNRAWWVTSVVHEGQQPQVLKQAAPDRGMSYTAFVTAIPDTTRYVSETIHQKNRIVGEQSAIVCGPAGEEVYTDGLGRVKVQFFWDREGQHDENTTCWIRVAQGWAGMQYGTLVLPRIGHEVLVSFLEGDPDRPLVTGCLYNADNKPPYELPEHKTRTVFKSMSTPAQEESRGFNELRLEDKAGQEEIYIHAEKDVHIDVKNDWEERIVRDRYQHVEHDTYTETEGETYITLKGQRQTELFADDNVTLHADRHVQVDGKWLGKAGKEIHIHAGKKIVLEAGSELTVKAGGSWLKLNAAGVHFGGTTINIASGGSPGEGTEAEPLLPRGNYDERIKIISEEGLPMPNTPYFIKDSSGNEYKGFTDENGLCPRVYTSESETLEIYVCLAALERW